MKQKLINSLRLRVCMLVAVLCSAFAGQAWAESVKYSVATASSVTKSAGTAPTGSSVTFVNTYTSTATQITKGKSQTLTLKGYEGCAISNITLSMKSNSSSGAGKLSYSIDGGSTFTYLAGSSSSGTSFNQSAWYGSWSTSWVDVSKNVNFTATSSDIIFKIECTTNSLHCQSFTITYTPAHALTYSATNGSIGGVVYNTSTVVASGAAFAEGGKVTLTANPDDGYVFDSWEVEGTGSTLSSTSTNPTTFTMGTANATVTANFVAAGDYITASPTTKNMTSAGGDAEFTISTDQTLDDDPTQFYTTADGDVTTTKPAWITEALYDEGTLLLSVAANTGAARTAYFRVEKGSVKSDVITINQAAITVDKPRFDVIEGTYYEDQLVDITCDTDGATIYYTTDGSAPAANNGTEYDGNGVEITENTTLKAIAIKNDVSSEVATAAYTIIHPLTTMDAIFTASASEGSYYVTLNNWVVSGVKNSQAFVTDGTKGFIIYKSGHGFAVGNILSGTVQASLTRFQGSAEFTTLTSSTKGLTVTTGGTVSPQVVTIDGLSGVNTGALIQLNGVTYDETNNVLKDASANTITPYTTLYSGSYEDETKYNVVGVYQQQSEAPHRIMPRSAADIVEVTDPTISVESSLEVPNYVVGTADPTYETLTVNGSYLTADITLSLGLSSNFEMSTDLENWTNSLTLTQSEGSVTDEEVAIRLKAGLVKGAYEGTLTLSSTGATNKNVSLSGSVTGTTYAISVDDNVTGGTIEADLASAEEGTTVSLTATPGAAYTFGSWTVYEDDMETTVTVTNNQFTMPACEVYVTATFNAKPTYAITCVADPDAGGTLEALPTSAYEGQTVTLSYLAEEGYDFSSIVITKTSDGSATGITPAKSGDDYTFTMPGYAVTATATFLSNTFEGSFAKVTSTSALEDEAYYILYSTKAMNSTVSSGKMGATEVTINNDIIENPNRSIVWKLVKNGDNWDLYSEKEEKYCYIEGTNTSAFKMAESASYHYAVTAYPTGGGFKFQTTHSSSRGINYGSDNFGSYADSNDPVVYLFKYTTLTPRTITFNGNGGTYNEATTYTQDVYDGVQATLDGNQFTRDGYEFVAWNNQADGEGANTYDDEDDITLSGGDLTLYAQWTPLYTLTIDNSIDGGTVAVEGDVTSSIEGVEITLTSTPSAGHAFSAWDVYKAGDTSTKVTVTDNKFTMPAYNVVISATFEEVQTYSLITNVANIVSGKHYIIASGANGSIKAMGAQNTSSHYRNVVSVSASTGVIPETTGVYEFVIYGPDADGYYTIYDAKYNSNAGGYLYASSSNSNYLDTQGTNNNNGKWSIGIANTGAATINAQGTNSRNCMRFNSDRFSCYGSNTSVSALPYLYVKDGEATPTESVTVSAAGYATYSSENALDFTESDIKAYIATATTANSITLTKVTKVPANTGLVLKMDGGTTENIPSLNGANADNVSSNLLKVSNGSTTGDGTTIYSLGVGKVEPNVGKVGFYLVNDGVKVPAGKAYLTVAAGVKEFLTFIFDELPTAVQAIESPKTADNAQIFNLAGQRLSKLQRGVNIVNGKKVLVK